MNFPESLHRHRCAEGVPRQHCGHRVHLLNAVGDFAGQVLDRARMRGADAAVAARVGHAQSGHRRPGTRENPGPLHVLARAATRVGKHQDRRKIRRRTRAGQGNYRSVHDFTSGGSMCVESRESIRSGAGS